MLFSSVTFLFAFLPLVLLCNFLAPKPLRNHVLLVFSLVFYAWGCISYSLLLLLSILINYGFGLIVDNVIKRDAGSRKKARCWLALGVALNLGLLVVFKYTGFFMHNMNKVLVSGGFELLRIPKILLPVGISFFTFQGLSYLVDVYRGTSEVQKKIVNLALFVSLFPQLIAGPIVRYHDVDLQLKQRFLSRRKFSQGVERFLIGLAKKVILANSFAIIADAAFTAEPASLSTSQAWLGVVFYGLQIYYDFAGYSDMAIGLGRMLGFHFLENFNFPYISTSIREFWRRWHISLSNWFRDYLYIPLGGNKKGPFRTYFNLFIVFFLTGLWHGAGMNFILWGLIHGFFMIIERLGLGKFLKKIPKVFSNAYVVIIVLIAWVPFRAENIGLSIRYIKRMFTFSSESLVDFSQYYSMVLWLLLAIAIAGAYGFFPLLWQQLLRVYRRLNFFSKNIFASGYDLVAFAFFALVLIVSTVILLSGSYNPFIYFRF
jgi:alginate O-acetyltransferase complex protein AlgI